MSDPTSTNDNNGRLIFGAGDNCSKFLLQLHQKAQRFGLWTPGGVTHVHNFMFTISGQALLTELRRKGEPVFEGVANRGVGVIDTLKAVAKQVLLELRKDGTGKVCKQRCSSVQTSTKPRLNPLLPY